MKKDYKYIYMYIYKDFSIKKFIKKVNIIPTKDQN